MSPVPDFDALLLALLFLTAVAAVLVINGNLTVALRRKPAPRKPPEAK